MKLQYCILLAACVTSHSLAPVCANDFLDRSQSVDRLLAIGWKNHGVSPAEPCADHIFIRRVYLDVAGRIPTPEEVNGFVADNRADKRQQLILSLTEGEDYAQHFADTFDSLLMGRAPVAKYRQRESSQWKAWLTRVFRENRPWNDVVREILLARPDSKDDRGVVWFLYERNNAHQEIAEAVAPAFFGIRIECAQCHDHMVATEIEQRHYWGLVAFFNRSKNTNTKNGPRIGESAVGGFSEFADLSGDSSPNLLTFFQSDTVDETRPGKDEKQEERDDLYLPAAIKGDPRVPKFSRRARFVNEVLKNHPLIARAFVNRVWAILMGRGIVHPFDEMDSTHPPSHPELLDMLASDFRESGYNIRRLVRIILCSKAYQLESHRAKGHDDPSTFAWYNERPLTAEQFVRSVQTAVEGSYRNDHRLVEQVRAVVTDVLPQENVTDISDALFLTNNEALNSYLAECTAEQHLTSRLIQLADPAEQAKLAVRTVFGRDPKQDEVAAVTAFLTVTSQKKDQRVRDLIWSLLTSAEFRFNH